MTSAWSGRMGWRALVFGGGLVLALVANGVAAQTSPVQAPVQVPGPRVTPSPTPTPTPTPRGASELTRVTWQWLRTEYSVAIVKIDDPSRYTVTFQPDGRLSIQADCTRVIGFYATQGSSLTLRLGPTTLAACSPESQDRLFVIDISAVESYAIDNQNLILTLKYNGGTMIFAAAP